MTSSLPQNVRERMARILPVTLRIARAEANLSQEEVAERLGMKGGAYGRIEKGLLVPSLRTLRQLCEVLGVSLEDLVDFEGERLPARPAAAPVSRGRSPACRGTRGARSCAPRARRARRRMMLALVVELVGAASFADSPSSVE